MSAGNLVSISRVLVSAAVIGGYLLCSPLAAADLAFVQKACSEGASGWDKIVDAAKKEGEVLMVSTRSEADNAALINGFMKKYPEIKARSIRLIGTTLTERVEREIQAGVPTADMLVFTDPHWILSRSKAGELVPPCGPALELWKGAGNFYQIREAVPVSNEPWVLAYNTNLIKKKPTDWNDLLSETQFTGRVGMSEVVSLTVGIWAEVVDEKAGKGYFERLKPLKPRIFPSSAPLTQSMAAGEIAWAPYSLPSTIEPMKAKGAPVDWIVPNSGTFMLQRNAVILKQSPRPAAALLLMDFSMSKEGQALYNGERKGVTVAPGIQLPDDLEVDLTKVIVVEQANYGAELTQKWVRKFNELYR